MKHFAVIPTVGERNETLIPLVERLETDGVTVIVVDNGPDEAPWLPISGRAFIRRHHWNGAPVNLSHVWNLGLDWAEDLARGDEFIVAVLNDDLMVEPWLVQALGERIMVHDAAGGFPSFHVPSEYVLRDAVPIPLSAAMPGYVFALRGSKKLRADESLMWWYGDNDLDWRIRQTGGNVGVPDLTVQHFDPNGYTMRNPELAEQAGRDRATFAAKWGRTPW